MPSKQVRLGFALVVTAPLFAAFAYYCAYRAGCLFDGKQGLGVIDASDPWFRVATLLSWLSISLAVALVAGPTIPRALGSVFSFGVLFLPLGI